MTLKEKFEEAEFFLELIRKHSLDLTIVKHFFNAFLYSIESIPDYLLTDASQKFDLGLPIDEKWRYSEFKEKAKQSQNKKALDFYEVWYNVKNEIDNTGIGKVFRTMRDIHTHKTSQRPNYFLMITNTNPKNEEKIIHELLLHPDGHPTYETAQDTIIVTKKAYLQKWNEKRKQGEQLTEEDMITHLTISIAEFHSIEVVELCEMLLKTMKKFAKIVNELL